MKSFSLTPFSAADISDRIAVTGNIMRSSNILSIRYSLRGGISELNIPSPSDMPERRKALWEETCFELFLSPENSDSYREFNLSPAGHWNVYNFSSYREGREVEQAFTSLPYKVSIDHEALIFSLELDLNKISMADQKLNAGISSVIKYKGGRITYWALTHPGERADFHLRESFIIEL